MDQDHIPTAEEFEAARRRELARLNVRLASMTSKDYVTPQDRETLEGDTPQARTLDRDTVRRWAAASGKGLAATG